MLCYDLIQVIEQEIYCNLQETRFVYVSNKSKMKETFHSATRNRPIKSGHVYHLDVTLQQQAGILISFSSFRHLVKEN
jgi:hypothetical protein